MTSIKEEILNFIESLTLEDIKKIEERDPQYEALRRLYKNLNRRDLFSPLVVANALSSYQLNCTGEEYWMEFSEYFSQNGVKNLIRDFIEFLDKSSCNVRYIASKVKRIERVREFLLTLPHYEERFYEDMVLFWRSLSRAGGWNPRSKTVVFSVKMFGYAMRIKTGRFVPYPMEIPIPIDSRIKKITSIITNEDPIEFWNEVARKTGIPPLHLDSVLWLIVWRKVKPLLSRLKDKPS